MCGRLVGGILTQAQMLEIMEGYLNGAGSMTLPETPDLPPRWNIKPTAPVNISYLRSGTIIGAVARWWFVPHWHRKPAAEWKATTFNAKIETAHEKPTFRTAWEIGRCEVPALGYNEWTGPKSHRQPWFIGVNSNRPAVFFAGLHSRLEDGSRTCAILTRPAPAQLAEIHPRAPVILTGNEVGPWVSGEIGTQEAIDSLGTGWEGQFRFHRVARFGRDDEGPELIEPEAEELF
jgi:putative SOS response-associated peptidase YedK